MKPICAINNETISKLHKRIQMAQKTLLLLTIMAALVWSVSAVVPECPDTVGKEPAYFENPDDCGSYYECVGLLPVLFECPSGLSYDNAKRTCDHNFNVDCGTRPILPKEDGAE